MLAYLVSPKIQIILLLLFAWGEILKGDQNPTGQTSFKHLKNGKEDNSSKLAQGMKGLNTRRKEEKGNSTFKTKGGHKPFQTMPVVFLIELVLVLVCNLCTWMIRNYKNSIPFVRLNMIILVYFYIAEIGNIALTFQGCTMMFRSLIAHVPMLVAFSVSFLTNYVGLIMAALIVEMSVLRVLAVVSFGRFFGFDPVLTSQLMMLFTSILYLPLLIWLHSQQLNIKYVSPMESYLTGTVATVGTNKIFIVHGVQVVIILLVFYISYMYIKYYLDRKHSIEVTMAEKTSPSMDIFSLTALIVVAVFNLTSIFVIIYFQKQQKTFPIGAIVTSVVFTMPNFYFASKCYVLEHNLLGLRRFWNNNHGNVAVVKIPKIKRNPPTRPNQIDVARTFSSNIVAGTDDSEQMQVEREGGSDFDQIGKTRDADPPSGKTIVENKA